MKRVAIFFGILFILAGIGGMLTRPGSVLRRWILPPPPSQPVPKREEVSITVIEGWTVQDIQRTLQGLGVDVVPSDFFASAFMSDAPFLKGLSPTTSMEGYLFPDTYRVWKDELPNALILKQLREFAEKTEGFEAEAQKQGRSFREVVILASILEKEVRNPEELPIVAGIFMNRLKRGMLLQSDATLNYVLQTGQSRLTAGDLKNTSPYNTYKYGGLPPGPISNPGKPALDAALHPAKTEYLYFLTDSSGKTYFARTLEEHIRNRYRAFGE